MFYSTSKLLEDRHSSTYLQEYTLSEHVLIQIKWKFWILEKNAQGKTNHSASPSMDCNILQIFFEVLNYTPVIGVWGFLLFVLSFISCYWFFPFISFFSSFIFYINNFSKMKFSQLSQMSQTEVQNYDSGNGHFIIQNNTSLSEYVITSLSDYV